MGKCSLHNIKGNDKHHTWCDLNIPKHTLKNTICSKKDKVGSNHQNVKLSLVVRLLFCFLNIFDFYNEHILLHFLFF